jgi:hypothetical protein
MGHGGLGKEGGDRVGSQALYSQCTQKCTQINRESNRVLHWLHSNEGATILHCPVFILNAYSGGSEGATTLHCYVFTFDAFLPLMHTQVAVKEA